MRKALLAVLVMGLVVDSVTAMHVLVLCGNISQAEFPVLEKFTDVNGDEVTYEQTKDRSLPGLEEADILWIGQGEICENAYLLNAETENKIKSFVKAGGIVISVGQDTDQGRPCEDGWIAAPILGVLGRGTETLEPTDVPEVGDLFKKPNEVTVAHSDDAWSQPDERYIVLATIENGQEVGIALLKHGEGWYIITSIENEDAGDAATNAPIMENLIHYAVNLKNTIAVNTIAVKSFGKLSISWGAVKSVY